MKRNKISIQKILAGLAAFSILLTLTFCLSGCDENIVKYTTVKIQQPTKVSTPTRDELMHQLAVLKMPVIETSHKTNVVLSNDLLFENDSINVKEGSKFIFPILADLMRHYQKVKVGVLIYSDNPNRYLVQAQAQQLASLLWQQGIDTRLLYTKTYQKPSPWICDNMMQCTIIQYHYYKVSE
ncbi:MAG: hypothetical protein A2298_02320 [Gammaproteobacteria bacterium RIFOXYB2_FULL_38_6]|nr:MAG: hypothetical protein A2298_02320 [Gammaproteobacteria bacterium RIFOXYB2_FULL_38_6]